ncbi:MAG: hypothetical protein AAGN35_25120 [Bacteroidota bacterium]
MSIDFFTEACRSTVPAPVFGIRDGRDTAPAYWTTEDKHPWIATVENEKRKSINFHAIDGCVDLRQIDGDQEKRCDAMLSYPENLVFIELKEVKANWIEGGIAQLQRTIELFREHHDLAAFRKRRAFLANRRHPSFKFSHKERMARFRDVTGVRLIIGAYIKA